MSRTNDKRLTIALMIESDGPGGGEQVVLNLARELLDRNYSILPVGPADGCGWLAERFRDMGIEPASFLLRGRVGPRCVRDMTRLFRRNDVDIVHSHEFTMAVYGAAAARLVGAPHLVTMHGGARYTERWRRRKALRWAFRSSQGCVAVSAATRNQLVQALRLQSDSIEVIHNGIQFSPADGSGIRTELGLAPDELLILAVGNLYPVKGHIVLLRALRLLLTETDLPAWRLAIAGRGESHAELLSFIAESGLADRVHLLGYRTDVSQLLAAADVFAMPSLSEGLPIALLEAMYAGKSIVASSVGGIPEAVSSEQHALLAAPGDHDALAACMRQLLTQATLRTKLARNAAEKALKQFSVGAMVDGYESLYRSLVRRSSSREPVVS